MNDPSSLWATVVASWQDLMVAAGMGLLSGIAAYMNKLHGRHPKLFSLIEFVAETLLSGFVGIVAFTACMAWSDYVRPLSWWAVASIVGITSHQASRWLFMADRWLGRRIGNYNE